MTPLSLRNSSSHIFIFFFRTLLLLKLVHCLQAAAGDGDDTGSGSADVACIPPTLIVPQSASSVGTHTSQLIIAHRGASAHLPEHSLQGYRLALELGTDYIEPDIVATKDGQLIAIHSIDLNITTDVATKFPNREMFSTYMNKTGYWTYNFNLEELKTLRIQQRLPMARSTHYDGLFTIPTVTEILQLLYEWNTQIIPHRINITTKTTTTPTRSSPPQAGIYAELKSYPWLLEDAKLDLIDLLFQHMEQNNELWKNTIWNRLCSTQKLKIHDYRLPPFVLQAFEGNVLEKISKQWKTKYQSNEESSSVSLSSSSMPVPPMILLVNRDKCLEESFWFQVGDSWRNVISGIGPHKDCLYSNTEGREFMEKAMEFKLVVHPWTERPELEYLSTTIMEDLPMTSATTATTTTTNPILQFESVMDELKYLFCTVKVHGIFTESVETAVLAAHMGCDNDDDDEVTGSVQDPSTGSSNSNHSSLCYETDQEANLYVGLASFVMGAFLSAVMGLFMGRRQQRRQGGRRHIIPTTDVDNHKGDDDDDEGDMEML